MTLADRIETALRKAREPLTIDAICKAALGRIDERGRNVVRVNLHRLDVRGLLVKYPQAYAIRL